MKRILCLALALFLCAQGAFAAELTVGVCIYDNTDAFMSSMRLDLESYAQGKAKLIVYDSMNDQNLQNDQVDSLLRENVDALILNPADRMAAGYLIEKAKQRGIPVIFINRELGTSKMNSGIFGEAVFGVIRLKWNSLFHKYPDLKN